MGNFKFLSNLEILKEANTWHSIKIKHLTPDLVIFKAFLRH